jgi:O-antigen ligase
MNSLTAHPALGVGWGGYQDALDAFYGDIPRPEGRTDDPRLYDVEANEPLSFSWFLVTGVELGVAGLVAVLCLLGEILLRAAGLGGKPGRPPVAAGLLGAGVALLLAGLWAHPLTRGAGPLAGLLLAMSGMSGSGTTKETA